MSLLRDVFTSKNFLSEELPLTHCCKIFTNVFVNQVHLEFAIETLVGLDLYRRSIRESHFKWIEENLRTNVRRISNIVEIGICLKIAL